MSTPPSLQNTADSTAEVEPRDCELTQFMTVEERMKLFEREPHCQYLSKLERESLLQPDREYARCLACDKTIMWVRTNRLSSPRSNYFRLDGRYVAYISAFKTVSFEMMMLVPPLRNYCSIARNVPGSKQTRYMPYFTAACHAYLMVGL